MNKSNYTRRVSIAAAAIVRHVASGGWLGANWPLYVRGLPGRMGHRELDRARYLADLRASRVGWDLYQTSVSHFLADVDQAAALLQKRQTANCKGLSLAVNQGKFQLQFITYDSIGFADIQPLSDWVYFDEMANLLQNEIVV